MSGFRGVIVRAATGEAEVIEVAELVQTEDEIEYRGAHREWIGEQLRLPPRSWVGHSPILYPIAGHPGVGLYADEDGYQHFEEGLVEDNVAGRMAVAALAKVPLEAIQPLLGGDVLFIGWADGMCYDADLADEHLAVIMAAVQPLPQRSAPDGE